MLASQTGRTLRISILMAAALCILQFPVAAQSAPPDPPRSTTEFRIHIGMWTTHLKDFGRGLDNNWLVGVSWRGYYGGTFVNSYGGRAFTGGIQRTLAKSADALVAPSLGYRLGFVTGYDERFMGIAGRTPILPLAQLVGDLDMGRTGVELAWAGLIATMGPSLRF